MRAVSVFPVRQMSRWFAWLVLFSTLLIQTSCATNRKIVFHSFEFDARWDSPGIEIIDYRYGQSKNPVARGCPPHYAPCERIPQQAGTSGRMLVGDDLYVKWRIKSTGEVYEDTVDLKSRLPHNIAYHEIHVIVHGPQLYVYLISPERVDGCPTDFSKEARQCIQKAMASNGGVVMGCPQPKEQCRITEPCPSADLRILSGYCYKEIVRLYPGQPEPLNFKFK